MDFVSPVEALLPGARGRVLGVLTRTEAELTVRTLAGLARVSPNQTGVVISELVELGIVSRREAGSSSLVRLDRDNEASLVLVELAHLRDRVLDRLARAAKAISPPPLSLLVFGSFARSEARRGSDLDVVVVTPAGHTAVSRAWSVSFGEWEELAARATGNPVRVVELPADDLGKSVAGRRPFWSEVVADQILLAGEALALDRNRVVLAPGAGVPSAG